MAQSSERLALLRSVLPSFLALAESLNSRDPDAAAGRVKSKLKLEDKDPFYVDLHVELRDLSRILSAWGDPVTVPEMTLEAILDVLESRVVGMSQPSGISHAKLRDLRTRIDHPRGLRLNRLHELILIASHQKKRRTYLTDILEKCNKELKKVLAEHARTSHTPNEYSSMAVEPESDQPKSIHLPSYKIRELADSFHKVLTRGWECKCESLTPHTEAKLRLATHRSFDTSLPQEARFDVVFCNSCESSFETPNWQECEIRVMPRSPSKRVAFPDTKAETVTYETRERVDNLCDLIRDAAQSCTCLQILVDDGKLWQVPSTLASKDFQWKAPISLEDFIQPRQPKQVSRKDRYILAVILANALLQIIEGPWLISDWTKKHICFYRVESQARPDWTKPYLSTCCKPFERVQEKPTLTRVQSYRNILALGIILSEIVLGTTIEAERSAGRLASDPSPSLKTSLKEARWLLEECGMEDEASQHYVAAIKACVEPTFNTIGPTACFDNSEFRQEVYTNIVLPVERALQESFGIKVEDLDILSLSSKPSLNVSLIRQDLPPCQPAETLQTANLITPVPTPALVTYEFCLFDDGDDVTVGPVDVRESRYADTWLNDLEDRVHPLINSASDNGIVRVKIAILDTGIDLPLGQKLAHKDRIKECRSWLVTDEDGDQRGDKDLSGHGTHAAALLLKVAPNADLYVARVFKGQKKAKTNDTAARSTHLAITQAIKHATEEWEVDIITMSFGFSEEVPVIRSALKNAEREGVILFAAAHNEGGNRDIAWPARMSEVICIHATDGRGNPSPFTPTALTDSNNFSILGQAVKSYWPPGLKEPGNMIRKSGTSTATPIAAGIAAVVLGYTRTRSALLRSNEPSEDEEDITAVLRSASGIRAVFRLMTRKRKEYDYVVPWMLLDNDPRGLKEGTVCDLIRQQLTWRRT